MNLLKKILIVEDEFVIAENTKLLLEDLYSDLEVQIAEDAEEAEEILQNFQPVIALLDIRLGKGMDGISFSEILVQKNIPFLFLTAHGDAKTVSGAIKNKPLGYLVKPISRQDLFANLELAFSKIKSNRHFIFKDGTHDVRISEKDIVYLKADGNYTEIHTTSKRYVVRKSMRKVLENIHLPFMQTHRSYFVNPDYIRETNDTTYLTTGEELPLTRKYKKEVLAILFDKK